jgi:group I intron endonuclease
MSSIIYRITNVVNSKFYIGKTSKTVQERFQRHCYNHQKQNTHLYNAMRKYGVDKFKIEILEETNSANEREIYWIETLQPHYNMTIGGDGGDTSNSPNFKSAIKLVHENRKPEDYASYGMLGKKQSAKFYESIKKSNCCPVVCEGVEYLSVGDAQKAYLGISIRKRLDNPKHPEFYRLRDKTTRS